jgi:hypothetical protein
MPFTITRFVCRAQCCIAFSPGPGAEPNIFAGRTEGYIVNEYVEGGSDAEKQVPLQYFGAFSLGIETSHF